MKKEDRKKTDKRYPQSRQHSDRQQAPLGVKSHGIHMMVQFVQNVSMEQQASSLPPTHLASALSPAGGL